jgi:hypothetical protein
LRIARVDHRRQTENLACDQAAEHRSGKRADAADHDDDERLHQNRFADIGRDRRDRDVDDSGETGRHRADAEHDHEDPHDVDAQRVHHHGILDSRADDHPQARPIENQVEDQQRERDDADDREAVRRIDHESERSDARRPTRRRHGFRQAAEEEADDLDVDDAQSERHEDLILVGPVIKMSDDDLLHRNAEEQHEARSRCDRDEVGAGILVSDDARIAANHEHRAVREVENAQSAIDDRQTGTQQRQQSAEHEPVECLRQEIRPREQM